MANHDQGKIVSSIYKLEGPIVDDDKFVLGVGSTVNHNNTVTTYTMRDNLRGLIEELVFIKGEVIERWNAFDHFGFQGTDYCQICRNKDQPKCLEDFQTDALHYWDFAPFRWYRPVFDYGRINAPIPLGIVMTGQGLYTHHNGMWFDGGRTLVPPPRIWAVHAFTIDVWFKFYNAAGGTLVDTTSPANRLFLFGFTAPNTVQFQLNGNTVTNTFTYTAAADKNKWMIAQVSVTKHTDDTQVGMKIDDEAINCQVIVGTFFDDQDIQTTALRIGNGFNGYIRKIKIYDYPKMDPSMKLMYKVAPQGYKFHHTQPDCDICDIDYNFTCYTSGAERNEWDYDCKAGEASGYTCWGNDRFHCFSGYETLYRFHERCTGCPETGGDGFFLGDSEYECDDGDNNVDDGCNANGLYEAGFNCIAGTPKTATVGTEPGGDGRHINHAGDDGNTANGDGGSSTCAIENGYQCTDGNRNTIDIGWEICGDGIDLLNYPGDDGNTTPGDGGDASGVVEIGWSGVGGSAVSKDTCTEICGDGYRTNHAGDDKNTNNGDGCDSTGAVELGWQCGHEAPSIGWKISQPSIIDTYIDNDLFAIEFNETVILDVGWTKTDWEVTVDGPLTSYDLTWDLVSAAILMVPTPNLTVWFSFSTDSQFFGNGSETITVKFTNMDRLKNSAYNFGMINSSVTLTPFPRESSEGCGELIFQIIVYLALAATIIIGVLSSLLGHSMAIVWHSLSIIQFVNFIPFMKIYAPSCIATFAQGFDIFNARIGDFWPNVRNKFMVRDDFETVIDYKFIRGGYTTVSFLFNAYDIIAIWIILLFTVGILLFFRWVFKNSPGIKRIEERFRKGLLYIAVLFTYMRIGFLSMLNLAHADVRNNLSIISLWIAGAGACLVISFPMFEAWNVRQYHKEILIKQKPSYFRLNVLFADFAIKHPLQYMYYWQFFLRRFLFCGMLIGWPQDEYLALSFSTLMHVLVMLYVTYVLPFNTRLQNLSAMVSEAGLVVIHGTLFAFMKDTPGIGADKFKQNSFLFGAAVGIPVGVCALLILLDSGVHLKKIKQMCKTPKDEEPGRRILDDIDSSSEGSMTEQNISVDEKDKDNLMYQLYSPEEEKERIELEKKK